MIPNVGSRVTIYLTNGVTINGVVVKWGNKIVLDQKDTFIVLNKPTENILLYTIDKTIKTVEQKHVEEKPVEEKPVEEKQKILIEEITKVVESPRDDINEPFKVDSRIQKLSQLRKELINCEKEIIRNKITNHKLTEQKKVEYGYPGFFYKK